MTEYLVWLFIINTTLLILHEIEAAYWKEWKLFRALGEWAPFVFMDNMDDHQGMSGFVLIHLPLMVILLYALVLIARGGSGWSSLVMGSLLIIHFIAHEMVRKKGRNEFTMPVSRFILIGTLLISMVQLVAAINSLL